jgi:hypothetical protein
MLMSSRAPIHIDLRQCLNSRVDPSRRVCRCPGSHRRGWLPRVSVHSVSRGSRRDDPAPSITRRASSPRSPCFYLQGKKFAQPYAEPGRSGDEWVELRDLFSHTEVSDLVATVRTVASGPKSTGIFHGSTQCLMASMRSTSSSIRNHRYGEALMAIY